MCENEFFIKSYKTQMTKPKVCISNRILKIKKKTTKLNKDIFNCSTFKNKEWIRGRRKVVRTWEGWRDGKLR